MLENGGVRVLFYNGVYDLICNHLGTEKLLNALDWGGKTAWQSARKRIWNSPIPADTGDRKPGGFSKEIDSGVSAKAIFSPAG